MEAKMRATALATTHWIKSARRQPTKIIEIQQHHHIRERVIEIIVVTLTWSKYMVNTYITRMVSLILAIAMAQEYTPLISKLVSQGDTILQKPCIVRMA